jgi:hypothetical protein
VLLYLVEFQPRQFVLVERIAYEDEVFNEQTLDLFVVPACTPPPQWLRTYVAVVGVNRGG